MPMFRLRLLFAVIAATVVVPVPGLCGAAAAQPCGPGWLAGDGLHGVNGTVYASTLWDPDGPGPRGPVVVVAGDFTRAGGIAANRIAAWDPATGSWSAFGNGSPVTVYSLAVLPSGELVAGRAVVVMRWDGVAWQSLGSGSSQGSTIEALKVLSTGELIAGGSFTRIGGVNASNIASWDGSAWSPLHTGINGTVFELDELPGGGVVAGGVFSTAGGVQTGSLALWDGQGWAPVGTGFSGQVSGLRVLVDGRIIAATGSLIRHFDGGAWTTIGTTQVGGHVSDIDQLSNGDVVVAGRFFQVDAVDAARVARWDGVSWWAMGEGISGSGGAAQVFTLAALPTGGIVAGGTFEVADRGPVRSLALWTGSAWTSVGGMSERVLTLAPLPSGGVVAGGAFASVGAVPARRVAAWDGAAWSQFGPGLGSLFGGAVQVNAVAVLPGGEIVAGGTFSHAGQSPVQQLARWDGAAWQPMGEGATGPVHALAVLPSGEVVAGGSFTIGGCASCRGVARWDGDQWQPMGAGLGGTVHALAVHPDGGLVAGGVLSEPNCHVARWDGHSWVALGVFTASFSPQVRALAVLPSGEIVAGGLFTGAGGTPANSIARWNGSTWSPLGAGVNSTVNALAVLPGGDLVAAGEFTMAGGSPASRIARWDGAAWHPLGAGLTEPTFTFTPRVYALAVLASGELVVGGSFTQAGDQLSAFLARWSQSGAPWVARDPAPAEAAPGADAEFAVAPAAGYGATVQWRKDGAALVDGPTPHGSVITGANAATLRISSVYPEDAGSYRAVVANACGQTESAPAPLAVAGSPTCPADWNDDGQVNSGDITAFLTSWLGSLQGGTLEADFNGDGQVNSGDITAFLTAWLDAVGQGGC